MADDPKRGSAKPVPSGKGDVGSSAAMMSGLVIVSRITGFFRTWCQALALGATVAASCYTVANGLPNQLYELVMGGMLVTAFLPVYMSVKDREGLEGATSYASNLTSLVIILMGAISLLGFVFAAQVVWTQSFSATSEFDFDLAVYFFRFFVIEVLLYALSTIFSGILNAERDYFWSTAAPIFNNIVTSASFLLYMLFAESNPALAIFCLAIGNPLGVAVQVFIQLPSILAQGIELRWYVDVHDPHIKETLSSGIPSLVVTVATFVTLSVQTSSALSVTASGASIAYYARLWYVLPYSIISIPITTAMFTELSDRHARGDSEGFVTGVVEGTEQIMFMLIPFAMFLVAFAMPLVRVVGARSLSTEELELTASYLKVLSLSLPFYGVTTYLQKVCSSLRRMGFFAVSSCLAGIAQVVFCFVLTPVFGLDTVAASTLMFYIVMDASTFILLFGWVEGLDISGVLPSSLRAILFGLLGSAVGVGILFALERFVAPLEGGVLQAILYCAVGGIPSVLITFGIAYATGSKEMAVFSSVLDRIFKRNR
ncbi:MAG: murein biosynthesis integral membrane protein MurJ [Atopobiaceae bacterium]|nr:murein biosynthesis integral membrane protein MurJ [Atopobiaceae bacterium]